MALGISILTAFGFLAAYWKIRSVVRINDGDKPVDIVVDGYKDQAARNDGAPPMASRAYQAPASEIDAETGDDELTKAYNWLKANVAEFSGAADVQP